MERFVGPREIRGPHVAVVVTWIVPLRIVVADAIEGAEVTTFEQWKGATAARAADDHASVFEHQRSGVREVECDEYAVERFGCPILTVCATPAVVAATHGVGRFEQADAMCSALEVALGPPVSRLDRRPVARRRSFAIDDPSVGGDRAVRWSHGRVAA
tara:strand:+ start:4341 stop:4814 length:474 start_codon:yes stop_codon:yes gene_type:complete